MDSVIHCISTTVPATSASNPIYDIQSNLIATVELLQLMQAQNIHRLVYLSSGGTVYGNPITSPVLETSPLNPISSYGAVKVAIEKFIEVSHRSWGIKPLILRPSNPFGERQGHNGVQGLISTVLQNIIHSKPTVIYGDGTAVRDYIYVKDVAEFACKALSSDQFGIYNVGSAQGLSINQVIAAIERVTGLTALKVYKEIRGFDVNEIVLDCSLAEKSFDWKATMPFDAGIEKQFNWLGSINGRTDR
jgi:UDP-glucose 4-epimerase